MKGLPAIEENKATVLVVDDTQDNLALMSSLLKDNYRVKIANSGKKALRIAAADPPPDLILLDIMMQGMDGYEVCRLLKSEPWTRDIPVIFLTAMAGEEDEQKGLALGAVDYIIKPISPPIVMARVKTHLALKAATDLLRDENDYLESEVVKRTSEIVAMQDATILAMASLAETRDSDTGNHIRRTQHYVKALALKLRTHTRFATYLTAHNITTLFKSAALHDIGKIGIPDSILLKPGRLEPEEFEIIKKHTTLGCKAIEYAEKSLGTSIDFLRVAKEICRSHHEKWDGTGYPEGLSGESICISARLMALADVYDALVSQRGYRDAMSHESVVKMILASKGSHFDPDIVDAFVEIQDEFRSIAIQLMDKDHNLPRLSTPS